MCEDKSILGTRNWHTYVQVSSAEGVTDEGVMYLKVAGTPAGSSDLRTLATVSCCCLAVRPFMISLETRTKSSYVHSSGTL